MLKGLETDQQPAALGVVAAKAAAGGNGDLALRESRVQKLAQGLCARLVEAMGEDQPPPLHPRLFQGRKDGFKGAGLAVAFVQKLKLALAAGLS